MKKEIKTSVKTRILSIIKLLFFLYLFIFSLVLLKEASFSLGKGILKITQQQLNPVNAFGVGWLTTLIMQSSGAATSALISLNAAGLFGPIVLIFMVLGTRIGTSITSMAVSLISKAKKRRDFRHGFEISLANLIYALPIAVFMFILEYFFHVFSSTGAFLQNYFFIIKEVSIISIITSPLIKIIMFSENKLTLLFIIIFALVILALSIEKLPKAMLGIWGKENTKKIISKYLEKKYSSFLVGFFITAVMLSTSITISLLIPIIIARFVNLKKVIPYLIGANLGGIVDVIISSFVIGKSSIPAISTYILFSILGLIWLFNTNLMFNITKYISKKIIEVSKKRAIIFTLLFILIAIILTLIKF